MTDAYTRLMGLIGDPVEHSESPFINNSIGRLTGTNIAYLCFRTDRKALGRRAMALKELGAAGFNVTIPYKTDIIEFLDDHDDDVKMVKACNTVKITDGKLIGHNTDIEGFGEAFSYDTSGTLSDKKIIVLGAGGAARAIVHTVIRNDPSSLTVLNRTVEKARTLSREFPGISCGHLGPEANKLLSEADIIINATNAGMQPDTDTDPLGFFKGYNAEQTVYDIIYKPGETKLLKTARGFGAKTANGLSMLILQAVRSFELINDITIGNETRKMVMEYIRLNRQKEPGNGS